MSEEKKMTNYERKMEARRQQAEKEKKEQKRTAIIAIAVVAVIVAAILITVISSAVKKSAAMKETYITVGEHEITKVEYDYFYYDVINKYLTMYGDLVYYMGLDTTQPLDEQQYDEDLTWKDAFDRMTVAQIQQVKALNDKAAEVGFTYDDTEDYAAQVAGIEAAAAEVGYTVDTYYKAVYGEYASESVLKPYIRQNLLANAYSEEIYEQNRPSDEEIQTYYEEHKDEYDLVDYYEVVFAANVGSDATDEDKQAAMDEQKALAEEMGARLEAGENFEILCLEYFPEEAEDETEETEEETEEEAADPHLYDDYTLYYMRSASSEWLTDEARKAGDVTVIEDADYNRYLVVEFVERTYDETCTETISDELATDAQLAYLDEIILDYEVVDVNADLVYLTLPEETEEETEE